jgi:hypothetical protein
MKPLIYNVAPLLQNYITLFTRICIWRALFFLNFENLKQGPIRTQQDIRHFNGMFSPNLIISNRVLFEPSRMSNTRRRHFHLWFGYGSKERDSYACLPEHLLQPDDQRSLEAALFG